MIVENLVVGQEFTHAGHISMGYRLADLCHVLIGYAQTGARFSHAVVRGAWYSVCQWSNAIAHPMQTSQRIAAALDTTGRALAVIIEENIQMAVLRCEIALLRHIDADLAEQKLNLYAQKSHEYYDRVHACMQECTRACAGLSVEQAGELTGQLLVDSYLINRMISVASYVKKCAHTHAREVFQTLSQSKQTKILDANKLQSAETVASRVGTHEHLNNIAADCPASCPTQAQKLVESLTSQVEAGLGQELNSIVKCADHGLERLIQRGFTPNEIKSLFNTPDIVKIQNDGAKAFIKRVNDERFNILIYNDQKKHLITALKNIDEKALINLGKKYGWKL